MRIGLLAAVALLEAARASALDPGRALTQYVRETWTSSAGAPFGSPLTLSQTPDGFLWLGTDADGLQRFDGVRFVAVPQLDRVIGVRSRINRLLTDQRGDLWIGSGAGLARLSGGVFTLVRNDLDVRNLALSDSGDLLVYAEQQGAFRVRNGRFERLPVPPSFGGSPLLVSARGDELWAAGTGNDLVHIDGSRRIGAVTVERVLHNTIAAAQLARDGALWIATRSGVVVLRHDRVAERITVRQGLPSDETSAVYQDAEGSIWIGTTRDGVARLRGGKLELFGRGQGFPGGVVRSFYEDREGSLWIVTDSSLCRLRASHAIAWGEPEGAGDSVTSVIEGRDGSIWTWADGRGLSRIKDGRVRVYTTHDGLASNFGGPLFESRDGAIWIGHDQGMSRLKDGRATAYVSGPIGSAYIGMITEDQESLLTFVFGMGLVRFREGRVEPYLGRDSVTGEALPMPFSATWTRDGTLWLATGNGAWTLRHGELRRAWSVPRGASMVASVHEDEAGTLWFAAWEGLFRVRGGSTTHYTSANGLPHDRVVALVDDGHGSFWLGTPAGIARVNKRELEEVAGGRQQRASFESFDTADGMRNTEVNPAAQPNAWLSRRGEIWFATRAGAVAISPATLKRNRVVPAVFVESVEADGRSLPGASTGEAVIPAGTQRVEVRFTATSLLAPEKVRFRYRLEGFDSGWLHSVRRRFADYTRLPPGRYTFRVLAANNDGLWNETGAAITLRQLPGFYETPWFYAAAVTVAMAGGYGLHRLRMRRHLRRERQLVQRVEQALAEVKQLSGLLPICAWCKKIRDDHGSWGNLEAYVTQHTEAEFTHCICPECAAEMRKSNPRG